MKKYVSFLLCSIVIFSLFSCNITDISPEPFIWSNEELTSESKEVADTQVQTLPEESVPDMTYPDKPSSEYFSSYEAILDTYRLAIDHFCVADPNDSREFASELFGSGNFQKEWFLKIYDSGFLFYPGRTEEDRAALHHKLRCGYATNDLNGDGIDELVLLNDDYTIVAIFSMANGNPILLGSYIPRESCWIDGNGWLHVNASDAEDHSAHQVYKIANGGASLELIVEYGTEGHEWIIGEGSPTHYITKYYKLISGEKTDISEAEYEALRRQYGRYLGAYAGAAATEKYSGLTFVALYGEGVIAMQNYEAAMKNEIEVYDAFTDISDYLANFKAPYSQIPLCEMESLEYAYTDLDQDMINELIINCGDTLILRYYEGKVYVYPFTFREISYLYADGSYSWNNNRENFEYGESKLSFDGIALDTTELWRIVNDGEPNAEYYIGGKQVSKEEILKYFEDAPKTKVKFSPLDAVWLGKISLEEAFKIADEYWGNVNGHETGALGTTLRSKVILLSGPSAESGYYHFVWRIESYNHHLDGWQDNPPYRIEDHKEVLVSFSTGRCEPIPQLAIG